MRLKLGTIGLLASVFAAGLMIANAAFAGEFPDKPLRLVTPYPPVGSHSLHAGIITTVAEPYFGQPMISIIRAGGGGAVAAAEALVGLGDRRIGAQVGVLGHVGRVAARRRVAAQRLGHGADMVRAGAAADAQVAYADLEGFGGEGAQLYIAGWNHEQALEALDASPARLVKGHSAGSGGSR